MPHRVGQQRPGRRPETEPSPGRFATHWSRLVLAVVAFALLFLSVGIVRSGSVFGRNGTVASPMPATTPAAPQPTISAAQPTPAGSPRPALASPTPAPSLSVAETVGKATRIRGPADAPITIVEFTDFQCPFCKRAHQDVLPQIFKAYQGKVRYVFRDYPLVRLHPYAAKAAEAARWADDQGKFWEYADALFADEGDLQPAKLVEIAGILKLDISALQACLDSGEYASAVQSDLEEGTRLGVEGTPTYFVNGIKIVGAQPFPVFKQLIDHLLAKQ